MTTTQTGLDLLRKPFPPHQISKLPKETKAQRDERTADRSKGVNCQICGGWHHRNAIHLDYVGHAALTDRLLDADPAWSWEPLSMSADGLPVLDPHGGMWIRLTVCGVTRIGYGHAGDKEGGDAIKEVIGDALRNAAMRFGAALELWHKGKLHEPPTLRDVSQSGPAQAYASLSPDWQQWIDALAVELENLTASNGPKAAREHLDDMIAANDLGDMEQAALWHKVSSGTRRQIDALTKGKAAA